MSRFLPQTLLQWLICVLVLVAIAVILPFGLVGYRLNNELTPVRIRNLINSAQNVGDSAALNANAYGLVADTTTDLMKKNIAPAIDGMAAQVNATMRRLDSKLNLLDPVAKGLATNLQTSNSLLAQVDADTHRQQERIGKVIDDNAPNLKKTTDSLAHASDKLDAYISDPKIAKFIDDTIEQGGQILVKVKESAGNVELMTKDGTSITTNAVTISNNLAAISADTATRFHALLYPAPSPWWKKYLLTPLKEGAGLAFILTKAVNGL